MFCQHCADHQERVNNCEERRQGIAQWLSGCSPAASPNAFLKRTDGELAALPARSGESMARFATKQQLLEAIVGERRRLEETVRALPRADRLRPGVSGKGRWSAKDVLAHLTEWEQMVLAWYRAGSRGDAVKTPAPDLNWRQLPLLNQRIFEKHEGTSLERVTARSAASYREILSLAQSLSEEDLFRKGRFAWLGRLALVSYLAPCTCSHYRWARSRIEKWQRTRTATGKTSRASMRRMTRGPAGRSGT